jgi:hypothetical protein
LITWGSVILLNALGANDELQGVTAMLGLAATSFMVGVIGVHYARKREAKEKEEGERR